MAKWSGMIGFASMEEIRPGVWDDSLVEKPYKGDLLKMYRHDTSGDGVNDNITINNQISIIADPYVMENFYKIKYVTFMGAKWKVSSVDASQRPRLVLSLGGVYNE